MEKMEKLKSIIIFILSLAVVALGTCTIIFGIQLKNLKGDAMPSNSSLAEDELSSSSSLEEDEMVVITASLNVRKSPDQTSPRLGALVQGQKVTVLGHEGDWTRIDFKGQSGYVKSEFLSKGEYTLDVDNSLSADGRSEEVSLKNKTKRSAKDQSEVGVFSPDKNSRDYYAYTLNGNICIHVPEEASDIECKGETLSYHLKNDWIDILFAYNIDLSLADKYDTERRIDAITSTLPEKPSYIENRDPYNIAYDLEVNYERGNSGFAAWRKKVGYNGASYFFIGPSSGNDDNRYCKIYEEAFNYIDEITMHEIVEIQYYDFNAYKNSFDTTMAQNQADREYDDFYHLLGRRIEESVISLNYNDDFKVGYVNSFSEFFDLFTGGRSLIVR